MDLKVSPFQGNTPRIVVMTTPNSISSPQTLGETITRYESFRG